MIIDCHSHIWPSRTKLGQAEAFSCLLEPDISQAQPDQHLLCSEPADITFVLGFVSAYLNAEIPNDFISNYLSTNLHHLIGFAGIDPCQNNLYEKLHQLREEQVFSGFTLSPACQNFHPCDTRAMKLYELAQQLQMPIYFLQGMALPTPAIFEFARPELIDEVARSFPELKMIISHLGYPWVEQTIALLAKHANVYSDVAGLANRPWQAYRSLNLAYEYDVMGKLLFASDFPCHTVKASVEALYNINQITLDSVLPAVPREQLRGIVERDSISLLGLGPQNNPVLPQTENT